MLVCVQIGFCGFYHPIPTREITLFPVDEQGLSIERFYRSLICYANPRKRFSGHKRKVILFSFLTSGARNIARNQGHLVTKCLAFYRSRKTHLRMHQRIHQTLDYLNWTFRGTNSWGARNVYIFFVIEWDWWAESESQRASRKFKLQLMDWTVKLLTEKSVYLTETEITHQTLPERLLSKPNPSSARSDASGRILERAFPSWRT